MASISISSFVNHAELLLHVPMMQVRTMRTKDHYEMREYSLDLIRDEDDESVCAEGRPYPIYPSKGGLNPKLLGDIIARF